MPTTPNHVTDEDRLLYRVRSRVEMAKDAYKRLVTYAWHRANDAESTRPRFTIPRREDDDDAVLEDVIDALPILLAAKAERDTLRRVLSTVPPYCPQRPVSGGRCEPHVNENCIHCGLSVLRAS